MKWFSKSEFSCKPLHAADILNATPDFIPIVTTAEKYLLMIKHDVKLLQWFAKCSQELPKKRHFQ